MKKAALHLRRILCLWMLSLLLVGLCPTALAAQVKKTTIKVAFYPLDGFFEYDEDGNPQGYGVEYLDELAKYGNICWEYVPVDSWEGIKTLMLSGEVDVRLPVSEPVTPSTTYSYTVEPMLMSYHAIMTLKNQEGLYYQDYPTISRLKIGLCENLMEKTGVGSYLQSIGVMDNLVDYPDYNALRHALDEGEIDALISNVMDLTDDMKILDKFSVVDNYITTLIDNPCYPIINDAMTRMSLENPSFQTTLYQKYFPERAWTPFTREESEYIAAHDSLTLAVYPNRKPVSYQDSEGNFHGIAIDLANSLSEKMGISFTFVPVDTDTPTQMLKKADLILPVTNTLAAEDCFITASLLDANLIMAVQPGVSELRSGARVGVLNSTPGICTTVEELGTYDLVYFDTSRNAFDALQRGKIDAFANSTYVISWMQQNPRYSNLETLPYQEIPLGFSLCGKAEDVVLQSILSKVIRMVSEEDRIAMVQNGLKLQMDDFTLADRFYVYRFPLIVLGLLLLALVVFSVVYTTSRSRYYRKIEQSSAALAKASIAKSDFLSRMSHDMRTPMNGILGITSLLRDRTDPEEIREDIDQIEMSAKYLLSLINDTLDMSKIESGKMELHPEPIRSEELFGNVVVTANILAAQKGVHLKTEFPSITHGTWVPIVADATRVEQIFLNVISNAIKFTPPGGTVTLHMDTVAVTEDSVKDRYIISDTGIGMSEAFQAHLFEAFSQEGRANTSGESGTGLGLAIVKQIVDLMGGTIAVTSKLSQGSTFTIELTYPRYHGALAMQSAVKPDWSTLKGKRILLCEDHPVNAQIATRLLNKQGMLVERAENGQIGVDLFRNSPPHYFDAVLMDIRMPVMNGMDAARAIRATEGREDAASIAIIALTANAFDDDREQTKQAGMNAHLAKPIEPEKMFNVLCQFIS